MARQAAGSTALEWAARLGFGARGLMYVLIGGIAVQVALGGGGSADRGGALSRIAAQGFGLALLWVLVVGFAGLALWRLSEAAFGATEPGGHEARARLQSFARAVLYGFFCVSTLLFVLGASSSATRDGDQESRSLTARLMAVTGGRVLVGVLGLAVVAIGVVLARESWTRKFLERMSFTGVSGGVRRAVTRLGVGGGLARAAVVALAGVFLLVAAVRYRPSEAEGIDGTLRAFAATPAGPALLLLVALGLVAFGIFSFCEARWRDV